MTEEANGSDAWISVDLGSTKRITGMVIQGSPTTNAWITKYKVLFSQNNTDWKPITEKYITDHSDGQSRDAKPKVSKFLTDHLHVSVTAQGGKGGLKYLSPLSLQHAQYTIGHAPKSSIFWQKFGFFLSPMHDFAPSP